VTSGRPVDRSQSHFARHEICARSVKARASDRVTSRSWLPRLRMGRLSEPKALNGLVAAALERAWKDN
jgi:hypothetical protein